MKILFTILSTVFFTVALNPNQSWALTNSTPAEGGQYSPVAMIRSDAKDQRGEIVPAFCNATLLSARVLITAAHCVSNAYQLGSNKIQIDVGSYRYVKKVDGRIVRVGYVPDISEIVPAIFIFTPSLQARLPNMDFSATIPPVDDFAIIILTKDLPLKENFPFAQIISRSFFQGAKNSLLNYAPTVVSINIDEPSADTKRLASLDNISLTYSGTFESKSSSRVQEGDSGSPLFVQINGKQNIIAVVKGEAHSFFSNWDVFVPISNNICDMAAQIGNPNISQLICN